MYSLPAFSWHVKMARCHLAPRTTVRGPGEVSAALILESILQQLAGRMGTDPVGLREKLMVQLPEEAVQAAVQAEAAALQAAVVDGGLDGAHPKAAVSCDNNCSSSHGMPHPKYLPKEEDTTNSSSSSSDSGSRKWGLITGLGSPLPLHQYTLPYMWQQLKVKAGYEARRAAVDEFNQQHRYKKRGLAMVPAR